MLIRLTKESVLEDSRVEGELISSLEEELGKGIATYVLAVRLVIDWFFSAKHKGLIVRTRSCHLRHKETKRYSTNPSGRNVM